MTATKVRPWTPAKGEQFEAFTVGNVTVKLYRRHRETANQKKTRTIYELADYTSGRRKLRGFGELADARREADRIARQLSSGEATAATMSNAQAASFGRSTEIIRPTGASLELAATVYAKCFEILGGDYAIEAATFFKRHRVDKIQHRKVADVVTELLKVKEARGKSARYIGDLRARLTRFSKDFAVDISTITTADVQQWLDKLNLAAQTCKNFRTVLHALFSFAEARGYIFKGGNPVAETESISANGGTVEIYTPAEISLLLKAASREFRPFIALAAFAGLRSAEIERMEWRDVDPAGGFITVAADKAKTKARRLVPIVPNLAQWLKTHGNDKGKVWKGNSNDLQAARAATVKAAGIPWRDNAARHSFISYRLAAVQDVGKVALEAGNSAAVIFKHYRELVKPEQAKAWFAIEPDPVENIIPLYGERKRHV